MDQGIILLRALRGGMAATAREIGLTRQAIYLWTRVPAEYLPAVERATGLPRYLLRPDICPPPGAPPCSSERVA
jgi:DNA-binding transcriptional regulator YdaS (Cro superfamily)